MLRSYSRELFERAQHQYYSCCTRRWFQAIPVIDVEPLVNQQQVCFLLVRSPGSLAKHQQGQPPVQNAAEVGQQLHKACTDVGFFYVSSTVPAYHGFPVVYVPGTLYKGQWFLLYHAGCKPWCTSTDLPERAQRSTCLVCAAGNHINTLLHATL